MPLQLSFNDVLERPTDIASIYINLIYDCIDGIKIHDDRSGCRDGSEARKNLFNKPVDVADTAAWDID